MKNKDKIDTLEYILKLLKDFREMSKIQQINIIDYFESEIQRLKKED